MLKALTAPVWSYAFKGLSGHVNAEDRRSSYQIAIQEERN